MIDFKPKMLIESQNAFGTKIASELSKSGVYAVTCRNFSEEMSGENTAVIIDNTAGDMDESLESLILSGKMNTKILVLTGDTEPLISNKNGVLFISERLGMENICELAQYCLNNGNPRKQTERIIFRLLLNIGFRTSLKGCRYITEIISAAVENPELLYDVTYKLYQTLAEKYGVTQSSVERSVRHSIESTYDRNYRKFEEFFGCRLSKPTNAEFISLCVEKIRMELL